MKYKSYKVYDDEDFFNNYIEKRKKGNAPNETIEKPIIDELVGLVNNKMILDLGCGDGLQGNELIARGAKHYYGIDGSTNMVLLAQKNLEGLNATVEQESLETLQLDANQYDLVLSRLVLHYIKDLLPVLKKIEKSIRKNGKFVCSIEHPIITSCYESYHKNNKRGSWLVDDYFASGERTNTWMGKDVIKYHRTIEEYFRLFKLANFDISELRESKPIRSNFSDDEEFERRSRVPLFMIFQLSKK